MTTRGSVGPPAEEVAASRGRSAGRLHRGRTVDERRRQRRAALLETALELFGTKGYATTTIAELSAASGVTSRYFYQEFGDREGLLVALYDREMARCVSALLGVAPRGEFLPEHGPTGSVVAVTRARLAAFVHAAVDDPRVARVLLLESGSMSSALEARRRAAHTAMAEVIENFVERHGLVERNWRIIALGMVGAVSEVLADWTLLDPRERPALDEVIDHLTEIVLFVRAGYLTDGPER